MASYVRVEKNPEINDNLSYLLKSDTFMNCYQKLGKVTKIQNEDFSSSCGGFSSGCLIVVYFEENDLLMRNIDKYIKEGKLYHS